MTVSFMQRFTVFIVPRFVIKCDFRIQMWKEELMMDGERKDVLK
jgi:hypothetical protein